MSGSFIFSTDAFDFEIEVPEDAVGDMHKLGSDEALAKAKEIAKAKAAELLEKVNAQIDAQTFEDVYGFDEPEYNY